MSDSYMCVECGAVVGHKGKCDLCGGRLKATENVTDEDYEKLLEKE